MAKKKEKELEKPEGEQTKNDEFVEEKNDQDEKSEKEETDKGEDLGDGDEENDEDNEDEEEEDGNDEDEEDDDDEDKKKRTADDLLGESKLKSKELGSYDETIDELIHAAKRLPKHTAKYGEEMYAQVTPFANLMHSPLDNSGFDADYLDELYKRMIPVYNRAKFIFDSVIYAQDVESQAGKKMFAWSEDHGPKSILNDMQEKMSKIVEIDRKLCKNSKAKVTSNEIPDIPDLSILPPRLWTGSQDKIAPPAGYHFVPEDLIDRSLETYKHFKEMEIERGRENRNFKSQCVDYCIHINNTIRETYVDITGFIDDLKEGFSLLLRKKQEIDAEDILNELTSDITKKKTALEHTLNKQKAEFQRLEEKAKNISEFSPKQQNTFENEERSQSASKVLEYFNGNSGLNYHIRGNIGDTGGLIGFWNNMDKTFERIDKTIKNLPETESVSDFMEFEKEKWEQLRTSFREAAAKWTHLK